MTAHKRPAADRLLALCWCMRTNVYVPAAQVRAGMTAACKSPRCQAMHRGELDRRQTTTA